MRRLVGIWVLFLAASIPLTVSAHLPTEGASHYSDNVVESFSWSTASNAVPPSWLKTQFESSAETFWLSGKNNRGPTWLYAAGATSNTVRYVARANTLSTVECPTGVTWDACAAYDGSGHWWFIEFAKDQVNSPWCQDPAIGLVIGCYDIPRAAVHELGHQAGLARGSDGNSHSTAGENATVVQAGHAPRYNINGWGTISLRVCDHIEMQRRYDVGTSNGLYADCTDHLGSAVVSGGNIKTAVSQAAPSPTLACTGSTITISGTARLITNSILDEISGNPLTSRTINIQRRPSGGTWATVATTTVASSAAWTKALTAPAGVWQFQAVYSGESTLAAATSATQTATWSTAC